MAFASNGAAIISGVMVPASEVKVLRALVTLGRPATVPEIATALQGEFSDASLYSLLSRLAEKRRLVAREAVVVDVHGTKLRRVIWQAHQAAVSSFAREAIDDPRAAKPSDASEVAGLPA